MGLTPVDYVAAGWVDDISDAAWQLTAAIRDIEHHELGDGWDLAVDDPAGEIARLRYRLDQMQTVITDVRRAIAGVERRAQLAARRRARTEDDQP